MRSLPCLAAAVFLGLNLAAADSAPPELRAEAPGGAALAAAPGEPTPAGEPSAAVDVAAPGRFRLLFRPALPIAKGRDYWLRFWARSGAPGTMKVSAGTDAAPDGLAGGQITQVDLGPDWTPCSLGFTAQADAGPGAAAPRLTFDRFAAGARVEVGPVLLRSDAESAPLDLRAAANLGFADPQAGDGKGGWSDQGPENDFAAFPIRRRWFGGIPFHVADPAANEGRAVLAFDGGTLRTGLRRAEIEVPDGPPRRRLYLLHTLCGADAAGNVPVARITLVGASGKTETRDVVPGRDVGDWWRPARLPNGLVACVERNRSSTIGVYLSGFDLPAGPLRKIVLETQAPCPWIVVAATLSDLDPVEEAVAEKRIVASDAWKAVDLSDLAVKPGTALDLSGLSDRDEAGSRGRVIVNSRGKLAFAQEPDRPLRFLMCPVLAISTLTVTQCPDHAALDRYAEAIARQGYNMVRFHFLDEFLMGEKIIPRKADGTLFDDPATIPFDPDRLDRFYYFFAALKKRGVYAYLDLATSQTAYTDAYPWENNFRPAEYLFQLFVNPKFRANWRAGVLKLIGTPNPYTGLRLADDPAVAVMLYFNEQDIRFSFGNADSGLGLYLTAPWREWLRKRYGTVDALRKAWPGVDLPADASFDTVPGIDAALYQSGSPLGRDMARFFLERSRELTDWYQGVVRGAGYTGLTAQWDFQLRLSETPLRAMQPVVAMHAYQAHPSDWARPGSVIDQGSSIPSGIGYLRWIAPTRLLDRPFLVSEYGHVFWNRFRHEQGLAFAGYAAFQDWDMLSLSHVPVSLWPSPLVPFNNTGLDPINRASEVVAALAFLRGDVAPSSHTVEFPLTEDAIFADGSYAKGFDNGLARLFAVCRMGVTYTGSQPQPPVAKVEASLRESASGGSVFEDHGAFGTIKGGGSEARLAQVVRDLREHGVIAPGNRTDPAKGVYESDTGELLLQTSDGGSLRVIAPRLEGMLVRDDRPAALRALAIESCSVPALVAAASLDRDQPLDRSRHVLLVFSTDALNTGMRFASADATVLIDRGTLPVLMRTGKLAVTLPGGAWKAPAAYALKLDGERADRIPVERRGDRIALAVDTARLPAGPTPFIEIVDER